MLRGGWSTLTNRMFVRRRRSASAAGPGFAERLAPASSGAFGMMPRVPTPASSSASVEVRTRRSMVRRTIMTTKPTIKPSAGPRARLRDQVGEVRTAGVAACCTGTTLITVVGVAVPDGLIVSSASTSAAVARIAASASRVAASAVDASAVIWSSTESLTTVPEMAAMPVVELSLRSSRSASPVGSYQRRQALPLAVLPARRPRALGGACPTYAGPSPSTPWAASGEPAASAAPRTVERSSEPAAANESPIVKEFHDPFRPRARRGDARGKASPC